MRAVETNRQNAEHLGPCPMLDISSRRTSLEKTHLRKGVSRALRGGGFEDSPPQSGRVRNARGSQGWLIDRFNDPSAGSPTETLLRLLLPLSGRVQCYSRFQPMLPSAETDPYTSPAHSIGRSDGRCVQRAGT